MVLELRRGVEVVTLGASYFNGLLQEDKLKLGVVSLQLLTLNLDLFILRRLLVKLLLFITYKSTQMLKTKRLWWECCAKSAAPIANECDEYIIISPNKYLCGF